MNLGFIVIHRKILQWEWYDDINVFRLFMHLLIKANHKDKKWRGIDINRGSVLTSLENLSKETKLSIQQARTAINKLKSTNEITTKTTNKNTLITLINYGTYQDLKEDDNKQNNNQDNKRVTNEQQTNNKRVTTTNNNNNNNNNNNINNNNINNIVTFWNSFESLPKVKEITPKRKKHLSARIKEKAFMDNYERIIKYLANTKFYTGDNDRNWQATLDYLIKDGSKYIELLEKAECVITKPKQQSSLEEKIQNSYKLVEQYEVNNAG